MKIILKQFKIQDSRINRDHCFGYYEELCCELVKTATCLCRDNLHGIRMTFNTFDAVSHVMYSGDVRVDVVLDFNTSVATITVK